jgi:hypothetical protein
MSLEATATPLNGMEVRKACKNKLKEFIDALPMLKEGNAFKQADIKMSYRMKAYPADCPVPTGDFQMLIGLAEGEDAEFDKDKKKLELLIEKRNIILENVNKINNFLNKCMTITEEDIIIKDNGIPDEVRIANKLPVPMIQTQMGRRSEILVNAENIIK